MDANRTGHHCRATPDCGNSRQGGNNADLQRIECHVVSGGLNIDALVTVAGGAAMLGWLLFALSCTPSRKRSQERYLALVFTVSVLALA